MSTTSRTNPAYWDSKSRRIIGFISAVLARSLRRTGRRIEPNPRPISREVDF